MSMWTAIALIAIAGIVAGIFNDKGKRQDNKAIKGELRVMQDKITALEHDLRDRVATLERIVTSPKEDLKRRFEHLDKAS